MLHGSTVDTYRGDINCALLRCISRTPIEPSESPY